MEGKLSLVRAGETDEVMELYASAQVEEKSKLLTLDSCWVSNAAHIGHVVGVWAEEKLIAFSMMNIVIPHKLVETRSCLVHPDYRGIGLQLLMHQARAVQSRFLYGDECLLASGVKSPGLQTKRNLVKLGFIPWNMPDRALYEDCQYCTTPPSRESGRQCCCDFFILPLDAKRNLEQGFKETKGWEKHLKNGNILIIKNSMSF